MLIRGEQLDTLSEYSRQSFEVRTYEHLRKCWPRQCEVRCEQAVRASIPYAIKQASIYGVTTEQGVIRFLDTMFALGDHFDTDQELPWAAEILNDAEMPQQFKMKRIWAETKRVIKAGPPDKRS